MCLPSASVFFGGGGWLGVVDLLHLGPLLL